MRLVDAIKAKLAAEEVPAPSTTALTIAERRARLLHILRTQYRSTYFAMGSGLEYRTPEEADKFSAAGSVFEIATQDPILGAAGLTGATFGDFRQFFAADAKVAHAVACNCHGDTDGTELAARLNANW